MNDQEFQGKLAEYQATNAANLESFRAAFEAGREPLKAAMLINGGAAVVLLNFLASVADSQKSLGYALTDSLLAFASGVGCAAVAFAGRYGSQVCYTTDREAEGDFYRRITAVLGGAAFAAFMLGSWWAFRAFRIHFA